MTPRTRKWACVALALVVLVVGGYFALAWWADARLEGAKGELAHAGIACRLIDAAGTIPPVLANSARFYEAALAQQLELDAVGASPGKGSGEPPVEIPDDAAYAALDPAQRARIDRWLDANAPAIAGYLAAMDTGLECRFTRRWEDGFEMLLPDVAKARTGGRCLSLLVQRLAHQGGQDALVVRHARATFALADVYKGEPLLISQLIRANIVRHGLAAIRHAIRPDTTATQLDALAAIVPAPTVLDGAIEGALRGEVAASAELLGSGQDLALTLAMLSDGHGSGRWSYRIRPLVTYSMARYLDRGRELVAASKGPALEAARACRAIEGEVDDHPYLDVISALMLPSVSRALLKVAELGATLEVARAVLAIERDRRTGATLVAPVAKDPFSGRTLVYRADTGAVYSVGENGTDDGGTGDDVTWTLAR